METKKARDLMIPLDSYPHVPYWFTLRQVTAVMEKAQYSDGPARPVGARFVLVFDKLYSLVGIVRRRDLIKGLMPESLLKTAGEDPGLPADDSFEEEQRRAENLVEQMRAQAERPISEVLRPIHSTVDHTDTLLSVASKMVEQNVSMLPVLRDGVVIGVIRSAEVFDEIGSLIL